MNEILPNCMMVGRSKQRQSGQHCQKVKAICGEQEGWIRTEYESKRVYDNLIHHTGNSPHSGVCKTSQQQACQQ